MVVRTNVVGEFWVEMILLLASVGSGVCSLIVALRRVVVLEEKK
ncbi:MAG: hypothetical protein ACREB9_04535 [Thermoplasmata archaeon]